ncbi:hypothetical protein [Botrytis cinerea RNA virus 2]|nr:hypothetical protein [Botrytis cinerea RNA virus 2]
MQNRHSGRETIREPIDVSPIEQIGTVLEPESTAARLRQVKDRGAGALAKYNGDLETFEQTAGAIADRLSTTITASTTGDDKSVQALQTVNPTYRAFVYDMITTYAKAKVAGTEIAMEKVRAAMSDSLISEADALVYPGEPPISYDEALKEEEARVKTFMVPRLNTIRRAEATKELVNGTVSVVSAYSRLESKHGRLNIDLTPTATLLTDSTSSLGSAAGVDKQKVKIANAYEVMHIEPYGALAKRAEYTGRGLIENSALAQLERGRAQVGASAIRLGTNEGEVEALQFMEPDSMSTPTAAAMPMIASIFGWLMHMRASAVTEDEAMSFAEWTEQEASFAVRGYGHNTLVSGMHREDIVELIHENDHGTGKVTRFDANGRLAVDEFYYDSFTDSNDETNLPGCNQGHYLLTIPTRSNNTSALTAAALAISCGHPHMSLTRGHGKLMAMASTCNVAFKAGIGASAPMLAGDWRNDIKFSAREMITLLGYIATRHLDLSSDKITLAAMGVASLFNNAASSHHDHTDVISAGVQVLTHPFCEPIIDQANSSAGRYDREQLPPGAASVGEVVLKDMLAMIELNCFGRACAEVSVAQEAAIALRNEDVLAYQRDHAYHLIQIAGSSLNANGASERYAEMGQVPIVQPELPSIALNALGLGKTELRLTGQAWTPAALIYTPGCAYARPDNASLRKVRYTDWAYHESAFRAMLTQGAGTMSTLDAANVDVSVAEYPGHVVDCKIARQAEAYAISVEVWSRHTAAINTLIEVMINNGIEPRHQPWHFTNIELEQAMSDAAMSEKNIKLAINAISPGTTVKESYDSIDKLTELVRQQVATDKGKANMRILHMRTYAIWLTIADCMIDIANCVDADRDVNNMVKVREAVGLGWWHGSTTGPLAKWQGLHDVGRQTRLFEAGLTANAGDELDKYKSAMSISFIHHLLCTHDVFWMLSSERGLWSNIGPTILGGTAMPAIVTNWTPRNANTRLSEPEGPSAMIANLLSYATQHNHDINAKITASAQGRATMHSMVQTNAHNLHANKGVSQVKSIIGAMQGELHKLNYVPGEAMTTDSIMLPTTDPSLATKQGGQQNMSLVMLQNMLQGWKVDEEQQEQNRGNQANQNTRDGAHDDAASGAT